MNSSPVTYPLLGVREEKIVLLTCEGLESFRQTHLAPKL